MPKHLDDIALTPQTEGGFVWRSRLEPGRLPAFARAIQDEGGQLLALWGSDDRHLGRNFTVHVAFLSSVGLIWTTSELDGEQPAYPDLAHIFPQADRMQRAAFDLLGIRALDAVDGRAWLRHSAWTEDEFPLRKDFPAHAARRSPRPETDPYPFIRVEGEGVHEIAVGPIHAATIEPGHFRFSVIGDRILRLEERLGYTHKGTEKRFEGLDLATGAKLAGRVSGDSHTAFAWAYCMAVETATACSVPERAIWLRALFLEMERVANHLGDLGFLGNDVALTFGFVQFWRLKEDWMRMSARLFGHRYLFDMHPSRRGRDGHRCARQGRAGCPVRAHRGGGADPQAHLRRAHRPAGSLRQHRHRCTGHGRAPGPDRTGRTRQQSGVGCARAVPVRTVRPARREHGAAEIAAMSWRAPRCASPRCSSRCG